MGGGRREGVAWILSLFPSLLLSARLTRTLTRRGQGSGPGNSHAQGRTGRRPSCLGRGVLCDWEGGKYVKGSHYDTAHTTGLNSERTSSRAENSTADAQITASAFPGVNTLTCLYLRVTVIHAA